jgi:nucleotide-binding universal stress UspA family protein
MGCYTYIRQISFYIKEMKKMLMPTKILVPTDFSQFSDKALDQALDIAKQYNAKVFLLHVLHEQVYFASGDFAVPEKVAQQFEDNISTCAQKSLQRQLENFPQAKEVHVVTVIREGVPYEEILQEEKERGIDLIVIASFGRSGIAKYLVGSVARNVLKGSKCTVLLTK